MIERILDKGLVINADIAVSIAGAELLGIKLRATLASFEMAARHGMEFPAGTNFHAVGWSAADTDKANCPECRNRIEKQLLIDKGCPICGWIRSVRELPLVDGA